jgi:2-polyprenyl-3-methyl-5-hydroxy-6-metoxy-1,4-benzoquinol methylase
MFLKHRALQAEYFDVAERPVSELADGYRMLSHMNRLFLLGEPFKRRLPSWLGRARCRSLSLLDLGAGDGSLGEELQRWAAKRGWDWRVTNLDLSTQAMRLNPNGRFVAGSALALPFCDNSFDVVMASQMAHHLMSDDEVCVHFREAWRVTRDLLFLNDLHRNPALYGVLWLLLRLHGYPKHFRSDGLLSVRRGWRVGEWRDLAARAGIPNARVSLYAGARVLLKARKQPF